MKRAALALLVATGAGAQGVPPPVPGCGVTQSCAALSYEVTRTDGEPGFTCTAVGQCVDLGPGVCNVLSTNAGGDVLVGKEGVCTPTFRVGNTVLGSGTVATSNGAVVLTNSYLQINGTSLVTGMLLVAATVDIAEIAANTCSDVAATVANVEANDGVFVTRNFASTAGYSVSDAYVSNAGTDQVTFRACNGTAGAVDPASGSYLFFVVRKQ